MWRGQIFIAGLIIAFAHWQTAHAVNFDQCLNNINKLTIDGKTDNHGRALPPSTPNATAITYGLCISQCGASQEPFQWTVFSQQFSSWLLPWLALVSQLPFGSNDKLDNLESMLLTLGSPTLAAYSLALTLLNGRWIAKLFSKYHDYANVGRAVRILSSLQQSPLRIDTENARLASLIMLPQNDEFWKKLEKSLDYTHTWSISAATSIAWVIIAYVFTIIDYFSQSAQGTLDTNGGSVGSLWLWLLPVVVGWLQISPKCDSNRLREAVDTANSSAYLAMKNSSVPCEADSVSGMHAISLQLATADEARKDERSTAPIFNYARFLPWVEAVMTVSDMFQNVSERHQNREPVVDGTDWEDRKSGHPVHATTQELEKYCSPRSEIVTSQAAYSRRRWGLDESALCRMLNASLLALMLQWGTTGAAVIIVLFTPTVGLGCRSASYIVYGMVSTWVWMMLLTSSIFTYYSTNTAPDSGEENSTTPSQSHIALARFSIFLRRFAKIVAALNAVWMVATGIMQFSGIFDRCYCNSSVFGLGKHAYNVITLTPEDAVSIHAPWIGGFSLAAGSAVIFAGVVSLFVNPPFPS